MDNVLTSIKSWASHPFSADMDLTKWALFTGLIIIIAVLWILVIKDLQEEV